MTGKKSFILYTDYLELFEELSDEDAGQLIKHIFRYVNDEDPITENPSVKLAFITIKLHLKRDLAKWKKTSEIRSEIGKKGGLASGKKRKQKQANEAIGSNGKQTEAKASKRTDSVNVNDNVSVNEKNKRNGLPELPTELNHIQKEWDEWVKFRKELKKPLTKTSVNKQFNLLKEHSQDAKQIIEKSIINGYQGLFPINEKKADGLHHKQFELSDAMKMRLKRD